MTGPSEVDPVVLAGEPDSARQLEGGDDDLSVLDDAAERVDEGRPEEPQGT